MLSDEQVAAYHRDGFVRLESASVAARCVDAMWAELDEERDDPSTWTRPVVRLWGHTDPAFVEAATSPRWVAAIRQVAPDGAPTPWMGGTCAIRFPIEGDPGDDGWHIDASYPGEGGWWVNVHSRDRALLMLALYTEGASGHDGVFGMEVPIPEVALARPIALATGGPGDVYLCHPFLVHAAQANRGRSVRFLSQPGVPWKPGAEPRGSAGAA